MSNRSSGILSPVDIVKCLFKEKKKTVFNVIILLQFSVLCQLSISYVMYSVGYAV